MTRAAVLCAALAALVAGCGSSGHATSLPGLTPAKLTQIETIAIRDASANGDAHPSSGVVYASRRHEANVASGAGTGVAGEQPVYLVVLHGDFVCTGCGGPPGHKAPRGDVITLVLDRKTLHGLDFGIGEQQIDTSSLGPGVSLSFG
jgi:hypothetical protein